MSCLSVSGLRLVLLTGLMRRLERSPLNDTSYASIFLGANGAAMAHHGLILSQGGATSLGNVFRYLPGASKGNAG